MVDVVTLFREGGPWMYVLLLIAMVLPITWVAPAMVAGLKLRAPAVLWFGLAQVPLLVGLGGTWLGAGLTLEALANASPDVTRRLAAQGLEVSLYTLVAGAWLSASTFACFAVSLGLGTAVGVGGTRKITPLDASPALLVALSSVAVAITGSWMGALVGFSCAAALGVGALQASDDDAHNARLVAARASIGFLGAAALLLVAVQTTTTAEIVGLGALARAAPDSQSRLIAAAYEGLWVRNLSLVVTALLTLGATGAACASLVKHLGSTRTLGSAALVALVLAPTVLLGALTGTRVSAILELTVDPGIAIAAELQIRGIELPTVRAITDRPVRQGSALTFGPRDTRHDGVSVSPDRFVPPEGEVNRFSDDVARGQIWIQADRRTRLAKITPYGSKLAALDVRWTVQSPDGLRGLDLPLRMGPDAPGDAGEAFVTAVRDDAGVWTIGLARDGAIDPLGVGPELDELLRGHAPAVSGRGEVHVWMPGAATVQDLIDVANVWIDLDQGSGDPEIVWRLDGAPLLAEPEALDTEPEAGDAEPEAGDAVTEGDAVVRGVLEKEVIRAVIQRNRNQIRYCYERELTKNPALGGRMEVEFTIGPDGAVASTVLGASTLDSPAVEACILGRFRRMQFPEPRGGGVVMVTYPLVFATP